MTDARKRRWSYASAIALATVTLFVFFVFQKHGPESTVRRLHAVVNRLSTYHPNAPFEVRQLKPQDANELRSLLHDGLQAPQLHWMMDGWLRPAAHVGATADIVRISYEDPTLAVVVVEYRAPGVATPDFKVYVVRLVNQLWQIDTEATYELREKLLRF